MRYIPPFWWAGRRPARHAVYARFGNKLTLLRAILEPAIAGNDQGLNILDLPEVAAIRAPTDQHE
jgi:hypothetical protein